MPKFISARDVNFFKGIARELVDEVIQNTIVLYKVNLNDTRTNLYGESLNKTWHPGVEVYALIDKGDQDTTYEGFGPNTYQSVEFKLDRWMLEEKNIYPQIGDIIYFNGSYFEIDTTNEIQFVGGQTYNNFSVVCTTFMVSKSTLNIEERID
jgi:hypothetical protein